MCRVIHDSFISNKDCSATVVYILCPKVTLGWASCFLAIRDNELLKMYILYFGKWLYHNIIKYTFNVLEPHDAKHLFFWKSIPLYCHYRWCNTRPRKQDPHRGRGGTLIESRVCIMVETCWLAGRIMISSNQQAPSLLLRSRGCVILNHRHTYEHTCNVKTRKQHRRSCTSMLPCLDVFIQYA